MNGHPRETDHPTVRATIETVERACIDAGVPFGAPYHDTDDARAALEAGQRILRVGEKWEQFVTLSMLGSMRSVLNRENIDIDTYQLINVVCRSVRNNCYMTWFSRSA